MTSLIVKVRQVAPLGHHPLRLTVEEGAELLHVASSGGSSSLGLFRASRKITSRIWALLTSRIFSFPELTARFHGRRFWQRLPSHIVGA